MYRIEFSRSVAKVLEQILRSDKRLYIRLLTAIESLSLNPYVGKPLKAELKGRYSFRVGFYRVLYKIHKDRLIVYIIDIGHRKEIYKRR